MKENLRGLHISHDARHRLRQVAACAFLTLLSLSCSPQTATRDFDADEDSPNANVRTNVTPQPDAEVAVIETDYGRIVIELYPNVAPQMVARFNQLVREGFYNGVTFHRVDPTLGIIQTGDPLSRDGNPDNDGAGGSDHPDVPAEFTDVPFTRGIVGAAREGARPSIGGQPAVTEAQAYDTANSQFFITLKRVPDFDRRYTVFGRVIGTMGAANTISTAPVVEGTSRPVEPIRITRITLEPRANFPATNESGR